MKPAPGPGKYGVLADNLALMCAQAPLAMQHTLITQCLAFMARQGVKMPRFEARCRKSLQRRMVKAHRKWQRNCTAIRVEPEPEVTYFSDRGGRCSELWKSYCRQPDALSLLKAGSRVSVYANNDWVVKHYHATGIKARTRQKLGLSRASISWRQGWLWALLGLSLIHI